MFFKIGPLENFANYSVKHPRWSLLPIRDSKAGALLQSPQNFQEHPFLQNKFDGCC